MKITAHYCLRARTEHTVSRNLELEVQAVIRWTETDCVSEWPTD